tara:strand:- start:270 stop:437 length:168 start_codon:yes stop_codon:yes gene_type:complete
VEQHLFLLGNTHIIKDLAHQHHTTFTFIVDTLAKYHNNNKHKSLDILAELEVLVD